MRRSTLRSYIERLAIASLLSSGCMTTDSPGVDMRRGGGEVSADLGCPTIADGCNWLTYVDGGTPGDNITYWLGDGGVDPCLPCGFETLPGAHCGGCEIISNGCGIAYFCSILDCSSACDSSGRRPAGLILPSLAGDGIADRLARMAHLEAASVPAFTQLEHELLAHGAPAQLVIGARRARADEQRHAEVMGALARGAGARPLPLDVAPTPLRPLAALALENAVEGCVRETAGAVAAEAQAWRLRDPRLARIFRAIAVDERRHADLAWAVDAWAAPRLRPDERRRIEQARAAAVQAIAAPRGLRRISVPGDTSAA